MKIRNTYYPRNLPVRSRLWLNPATADFSDTRPDFSDRRTF